MKCACCNKEINLRTSDSRSLYYGRIKLMYKFIQKWIALCRRAKRKNMKALSFEEFDKWYKSQERRCYYCGVREDEIEYMYKYLKSNASKKLTIDRKNNWVGYIVSNMVFACVPCNTHKGKTISESQMLNEKSKLRKINR